MLLRRPSGRRFLCPPSHHRCGELGSPSGRWHCVSNVRGVAVGDKCCRQRRLRGSPSPGGEGGPLAVDEVFPRAGRLGPYEGITAAVSINLSLPPVAAYATPSPLGEGGCGTSAYSVTFHFPFSTYTPPPYQRQPRGHRHFLSLLAISRHHRNPTPPVDSSIKNMTKS